VASRKDIALLQTRYYRFFGENRTLVIARAGELADRKPPEGGREIAGLERDMAAGDRAGGVNIEGKVI
jgi:hypothetical protein